VSWETNLKFHETRDNLAAIPDLREIRNPLTHIDGRARLDNVVWFDSVVRTGPDGSVAYLVDPRYQHHAAARTLIEALTAYLDWPAVPAE
jgi:hypothetical protein